MTAIETGVKRSFLHARGLRVADLDPLGRSLLDAWAETQAKVSSLDRWFDEKGSLVDEKGEPWPAAKLYVALHNSAQRAFARLEQYLAGRTSEADAFAEYMGDDD
jgi:hypothetical protein